MRSFLVLALSALMLAACVGSCPAPSVVVPSGATVICPSGSPAVNVGGAYRC